MLCKERGAEGHLGAPRIIVTPSVSGDGMQFQSMPQGMDGIFKQENKRTRKGSKVGVEHSCS